jgi:hypothetical protein
MSDATPASTRAFEETLDREVALLMSAVDLVAAGGAPSATVSGLRLCEVVMDVVRPTAHTRGVMLEPLWTADEAGCDVRVRPERSA